MLLHLSNMNLSPLSLCGKNICKATAAKNSLADGSHLLIINGLYNTRLVHMIDSLLNCLKAQLQNHLNKTDTRLFDNNKPYLYLTFEISINKSIPLAAVDIEDTFFLSRADSGFTLLGLGSFLTLQAEGSARFDSIKSGYSKILHYWENKDKISPIAFHAFAFDENDAMTQHWDGLPNTLLFLPVILIKEENSCQTLYVNINRHDIKSQNSYEKLLNQIKNYLDTYVNKLEALDKARQNSQLLKNIDYCSSITPPSSWLNLTQTAIKKIQSGSIDKIVTSRQLTLQHEKNISVKQLTERLVKHYPTCTVFSYHLSGKSVIAASPERLLSLNFPDIQSDAIGGTIHRMPVEKKLLSPLSLSQKLLKEHAFIAQDIYQRLDPFCHSLKMSVSPFLMKLHNMYHLETPIQGTLDNQYDLFDIIENLHPTPAVAGYPAQKAKKWLLENEAYNRGWYTGAFGWLDGLSNGNINAELSVMLRCALIDQKRITLFAGAGLVAESDPETEWQETELKMKTILEVL
ncbi:MAG: isochorismate synthase [gamma proteobacterium symbiont of Taylorina sp.]|nr:isochorismate synthase [gamma proteobacterium symbiont of Taylorina sp.]